MNWYHREFRESRSSELEKLNNRPMQGLGEYRNELFAEIDKTALKALPADRFQLREWKKAKVNIDYHITVRRPLCPDRQRGGGAPDHLHC